MSQKPYLLEPTSTVEICIFLNFFITFQVIPTISEKMEILFGENEENGEENPIQFG